MMPKIHGHDAVSRRALARAAGGASLVALVPGLRAKAQSRDRLVFALSSYPPSLRPWANTGTAAGTVKIQSLRGLLGYDAKGQVRGELAEAWRAEGTNSWHLTLREGVTFHDGEKLTPDAVRYSFEQMLNERATAYLRPQFVQLIDRIEAPDARSVRFVLKEPSATFMFQLASWFAPMISPKSTEANPVGAGPYRITDVERGTRIDFEAYEGYYRKGNPKTKKLRMIAYADENLRVAALEAGDVDIIEYVPWQSYDKIEKNAKLTMDTVDGPFMYLVFNVQQGPFTNVKLRQAVAYAVRREDVVKAAFFGRGSPLAGMPFPQGSEFFDPATANYWRTDLDLARKLMAEGGQPNGFSARLLSTAQYGMHKDTAEVVQQNLAAIGIRVELNLPDWATRIQVGNRGQYDFAVMGTGGDFNDPDAMTPWVSGAGGAFYSRSHGYNNETINGLLAKGRAELDLAKRKAIYREVERISLEDAALVGLAWRSQGYAMQKSVRGFANLPGFLTFYSGYTLEDVAFA
jgi:peptide/nickel transport system substrate-binding protein